MTEPARLQSLIQPVWWRWARLAERLITAAGPLTLHQLHAGISRARARRHETIPIDELGIALLATRLVRRDADHRYRTIHPTPQKDGDARLVAALDNGSAVITTRQVADILRRTGLVAEPGRGGSYHYNPFQIPVRRGHWTLINRLTSRSPAQLPTKKHHRYSNTRSI